MAADQGISIVTKWWVLPGNEDAAVAALTDLVAQTEAAEPFTSIYLVHTAVVEGSRPPPSPTEIIFVGSWPSRDDFNKHLNGPVFQGWLKQHLGLFVTDNAGNLFVVPEFAQRIAGFIRSD